MSNRFSLVRAVSARGMICRRVIGVAVLSLLVACVGVAAQSAAPVPSASPAVVKFTLDFPQSSPTHYSITVDVVGHSKFECTGKVADDADEEDYQLEFQASPKNRERIFEWTKEAHYFMGKIDSGNNKLAFTGTKILEYRDGAHSNSARYNYSNLEPVRELTALFQSMAGTLEYGRRLTYYHQYQKLALDEELKRMEAQAKNNELTEIQGLKPILEEIFEDTSVINVVRARAKELMQMGSGEEAGH